MNLADQLRAAAETIPGTGAAALMSKAAGELERASQAVVDLLHLADTYSPGLIPDGLRERAGEVVTARDAAL